MATCLAPALTLLHFWPWMYCVGSYCIRCVMPVGYANAVQCRVKCCLIRRERLVLFTHCLARSKRTCTPHWKGKGEQQLDCSTSERACYVYLYRCCAVRTEPGTDMSKQSYCGLVWSREYIRWFGDANFKQEVHKVRIWRCKIQTGSTYGEDLEMQNSNRKYIRWGFGGAKFKQEVHKVWIWRWKIQTGST
jgi:hypothetical protein